MTNGAVGFVGLGAMGSALAGNLVGGGLEVIAFDVAGTAERAPAGATVATSVAELATRSEVVVLSLPDGAASAAVVDELLAAEHRVVTTVIDTSTIGPGAARTLADRCAEADVAYLDAPVSGGVAGARARTITVMVAGPREAIASVRPVLNALSTGVKVVDEHPGAGQAIKLANNFLSATALAATSEALAFLVAAAVDPTTAFDVINASSGRSAASEDKFPKHVLTGTFDSGFRSALMAKDLGLYDGAGPVAALILDVWRRFAGEEPDADFTRIAEFVRRSLETPFSSS